MIENVGVVEDRQELWELVKAERGTGWLKTHREYIEAFLRE